MKEIIYNITQQTEGRKVAITGVNEPVNKNNVLGIINKTQSKVLYTPLQYANLISSEWSLLDGGTLTLTLADNVQIINVGDKLFVKLYLDKDIDFTPIENKVDEGVSTLSTKIDNIKLPEVDLSAVAKQGENPEATMSAILSVLNGVAASMYKGVPIVSQAGDATIAPNVWNVWGEVAALAITKGVEVSGVVNSYLIRFVAGEGCAITFDGFALNWYGGSIPTWNAGSTYEINIVDDLALWAEFTAV